MYLVHFEYVTPGGEERGTIDQASELVLQTAINDFWISPDNTVCIIGNYDRTGLAMDRMKRSQILAESVAAYLIAHGIPSGSITTRWKGDLEPAVQTEDGVEEPANRYVLVMLGFDNWRPC
jgi:outer membrane protein OmpA-like peptidoglycan-associated protein